MKAHSRWIEMGHMDAMGRLDTPIHRLDARAKIITTLAFIIVVMSFPRHEISALTPMVFYPVILMRLGRIPPRAIVNKIAMASPFALMIGMFNPFFDQTPVLSVGSIIITGGWLSFITIMIKFALTGSAALILIACTGMYRLGSGLEQLGVPRVFIMQLLFLYRYLFVVADEGITMVRAVQLRSPGMHHLPLRVYGSLTGQLFLRSLNRAHRVYQAMVVRGFDGHIRTLNHQVFTQTDMMFAGGCLLFFFAARKWNLAEAMGQFLVSLFP